MKTHILQTNFNNKLACECFTHIDLAPSKGIPESVAASTDILVTTEDNSHAPVTVRLFDMARFPLSQIHSAFTFQSHGMTAQEFTLWLMNARKGVNTETPMAIYFYKKITGH